MSWLDKVLAVPIIGINFKPSITSPARYFDAITDLLEKWADSGRELNVTSQGEHGIIIEVSDGFNYRIKNESIVVSFNYRGELYEPPGEIPQLRYSTQPQLFTELANKIVRESADFCKPIIASIPKLINRIGIVADCKLNANEVVPGVDKYMKHLSAPWSQSLDVSKGIITAILKQDEDKEILERCHHTLDYNTSKNPESIALKLDWQRYFNTARKFDSNRLEDELTDCLISANAYFHKFGMGDLNYGD